MFNSPGLQQEVKALSSSKAGIAMLSGVPDYLLGYCAYSMSREMKSQVQIIRFQSEDEIPEYINQLKDSSKRDGVFLKVGEEFNHQDFQENGYEKVDRVWSAGEYSLYGDVCVIWPVGYKELLRISIFGDEIELISLLNAENRRKSKDLQKIFIDNYSARDLDSKRRRDVFIEGVEESERSPVYFGYIQGLSKLETEEIGLPLIDLGLKQIPLLSQITENAQSILEQLIKKYVRDKYEIIFVDTKRERYDKWKGYIKNMSDFQKITEDQAALIPKGFIDELNYQIVLTPYEVFGEIDLLESAHIGDKQTVESEGTDGEDRLLKSNEEIFKKIAPGDYVVHEDHGVGRYKGIIEREEGVFIELHYSGKDKLFIPLKQSKKITKYIGGGRIPTLTTLNSGAWRRVRKRAEEDAEKLAQELIRLYAMRNMTKIESSYSSLDHEKLDRFIESFKYQDTEDQAVATNDVIRDMRSDTPMDRLLIGDVGFGKTEVALRAMYLSVLQDRQVAFLAPTTVLVEQHRAVMEDRFESFGIKIGSLSRFQNLADRRKVLESVKEGEIQIVVGTHSLLSEGVEFNDLGLIVIDEEQKFGVTQKEKLKQKRLQSHVLSMTATPIPRTLNMALSGIRDISMISTPPHGRKPIVNAFDKFDWSKTNSAISKELDRDGQVYFLHNRVKNIDDYQKKLAGYFPEHNVEVAHGQMKGADLASVMYRFGKGIVDILVCTTIIENGIDLPNVNTLIVHKSEMFGLSQLYQIRGRIGRSDRQAYAHFLYNNLRGRSGARMEALDEASDLGGGFIIASRDMEIRGAGEILGREQSGAISSVGYGMFITLLHEKISKMKVDK